MVVLAVIGDDPRDVEAALLSASGRAAPRCRHALLHSAGPFGGTGRVLALADGVVAVGSSTGNNTEALLLGVALQPETTQQPQQQQHASAGDGGIKEAERRGQQYAARRAALEAALLLLTCADAVLWLVRDPIQTQSKAAAAAGGGSGSEEQEAMAAVVRQLATLQQAKLLLARGSAAGGGAAPAAARLLASRPPKLQLAFAIGNSSGGGSSNNTDAVPALSAWEAGAAEAGNALARMGADGAAALFAWAGAHACAPPAAGLKAVADAVASAAAQHAVLGAGRGGSGLDSGWGMGGESAGAWEGTHRLLPPVGQLISDLLSTEQPSRGKDTAGSGSSLGATEAAEGLAVRWAELQTLLHSAAAAAPAPVAAAAARRSSDGGRGAAGERRGGGAAEEQRSEGGDSWESAELSSEGEEGPITGNNAGPHLAQPPFSSRRPRGQPAAAATGAGVAAAAPGVLPFPTAATAAEALSLSVDGDWFASQRCCAAAAHAALRKYLEALPPRYPEATHVAAAARAAAAYARAAAGPAAPEYARRLATACQEQWERGRRACGAAALLSGRPCLLAPHGDAHKTAGAAETGAAVADSSEAGAAAVAAAAAHDTGVRLLVALPDGTEQLTVPEWFDPAAANADSQRVLLEARRRAVGVEATAAVAGGSAGGGGPCPLEGLLLNVFVDAAPLKGDADADTTGDGQPRGTALGPWVGCWPQLAPLSASSSNRSGGRLVTYDPDQGLQQPGFVEGRNKLWRLEVRGGGRAEGAAAAAAAAGRSAAAAAQPPPQQQAAAEPPQPSSPSFDALQAAAAGDAAGGASSSWLAVAGGAPRAPVLGAEDFPTLQETLAGKGRDTEVHRGSVVTRGGSAPPVAAVGPSEAEGVVSSSSASAKAAGGRAGVAQPRQAALVNAWAAMGSGAGGGRGRELLAVLYLGLEYECFEDGRRLIASPGDLFRTAPGDSGAVGGRSGGRASGGPGGGGPGRMLFCPCPLALRLPGRTPARGGESGSGSGGGGGQRAEAAAGSTFRLSRLWVQTPDAAAGVRFAAAPAMEVPDQAAAVSLQSDSQGQQRKGWRFTCPSFLQCVLPSGALCALRVPPVYAVPDGAGLDDGGLGEGSGLQLRALDVGGGILIPGWLSPATPSTVAGADDCAAR